MPEMSHSSLLVFGKHKGKTFKQVYEGEKSYISWIKKIPEATGAMLQLQEYCAARDNGTFQDDDVGVNHSANNGGGGNQFRGNVSASGSSSAGGNQFGDGSINQVGGNSINQFGGGNSMNEFGGGNSMNQFGGGNGINQFGGSSAMNQFGGSSAMNQFPKRQLPFANTNTQFGNNNAQFGNIINTPASNGQFGNNNTAAANDQFGNNNTQFGNNNTQFGNYNTQFGKSTAGNNPSDEAVAVRSSVSFPSDPSVPPPEKKGKLTATCAIYYELAGIDKVQVRFEKYVGRDLFIAAVELLKDDSHNPATKSLLENGEDNRELSPEIVSGCIRWPAKFGERIRALLPQRFRLVEEIDDIPKFVTNLAEVIKKKEEHLKTAPPVDGMIFQGLRPFQKEGIEFAIRAQGRCIIGDEMGLGKTVQGLGIAYYFRSQIDVWPCLIICPSSLRFVWKNEITQWIGPMLRSAEGRDVVIQTINKGADKVDPTADFVIVSYNMVALKDHLQKRHDGKAYGMVIADEAHYIKDKNAKRAMAVMKIAKNAKKAILLTGTPAMNKACELFTLLDVVLPKNTIPSYSQYVKRYCFHEVKNFGFKQVTNWVGAKRPEELHFMTKSTMIRRLKRDVLRQLPDKTRQKVHLEKDLMDKKKMKELTKLMEETERDFDNFDPDGSGNANAVSISRLFMLTAEAKAPAVMNYISDLLDNCPADKKLLLFGHHKFMLDHLEERVKKMNLGYIRIDGSTAQGTRGDLVKKFQEDENVRIAVLSITACGVGLTLTRSDHVVFAELYWVPGQMQQAEDRVHRIGQKNAVTIQYLCAPETVDEKMFKMLDRKTRDTTGILNGVKEQMDLKTTSDFRSTDRGSAKRPPEVSEYTESYDQDGLKKQKTEVEVYLAADDSLNDTSDGMNLGSVGNKMNTTNGMNSMNSMNGNDMGASSSGSFSMNDNSMSSMTGTNNLVPPSAAHAPPAAHQFGYMPPSQFSLSSSSGSSQPGASQFSQPATGQLGQTQPATAQFGRPCTSSQINGFSAGSSQFGSNVAGGTSQFNRPSAGSGQFGSNSAGGTSQSVAPVDASQFGERPCANSAMSNAISINSMPGPVNRAPAEPQPDVVDLLSD